MTQTNSDPTTPEIETAEEARQGERKKGMPTVLAVSTTVAVIALAVVFAISLA